jgi:hypothetical protein
MYIFDIGSPANAMNLGPAGNTRSKTRPIIPQSVMPSGKKTKRGAGKPTEPKHHHYDALNRPEDAFLRIEDSMLVPYAEDKPERVWSSPLFLFSNLSKYVTTVCCPCSTFFEIFDGLSSGHPSRAKSSVSCCSPSTCCSLLSYAFFPMVYAFKYTNVAQQLEIASRRQEEEEEDSCCPELFSDHHGGALDYIYHHDPEIDTHPGIIEQQPDCMRLGFFVCLASGCIIPATCLVRQIASQRYAAVKREQHPEVAWTREPLWASGLVSCLAWPCGLVQVEDEIRLYNTQ